MFHQNWRRVLVKMIYNLFLLLMVGCCILSISPCQPLHAAGYPFDCPNIVCLIAFPNINQTPKQNYPSQLEKTSGYRKENRKSLPTYQSSLQCDACIPNHSDQVLGLPQKLLCPPWCPKLVTGLLVTSVSNSGQNFKTRVSVNWERKPVFFGFWNECDFERKTQSLWNYYY